MDNGVVRVGRLEMSVTVVQQETSDSGAIPRISKMSPKESMSTKSERMERRSNFLFIKGEVLVARSKRWRRNHPPIMKKMIGLRNSKERVRLGLT
jgi:hypothetical protein